LTGGLRAASPNAQRLAGSPKSDVKHRWLDLQTYDRQPLKPLLSGLKLEYRIIQLYSRDAGSREAALSFEYLRELPTTGNLPCRTDAAPGGQPEVLDRSKPVNIAFDCSPSHDVTFRVVDENGKPTTAAFIIRDPQNRVYPSQDRIEDPDGPNGLPNYAIPQYNGIGANEYIVDITHNIPGRDGKPVPAIDFISTMDTNRQQEFNMWYHTLNCGFRVRASGETDFPCISGQRVGMGRVYVKANGRLNYEDWCEGVREGRSYVSDGTAHLMDFAAHPAGGAKNVVHVGDKNSELKLGKSAKIHLTTKVAARLDGKTVPIEVIVNGYPAAKQDIAADGTTRDVSFDVPIDRSSWVALRIFPNAHTNPIFVLIGDKPIRASRRSAEWCLRGVDQCWESKQQTYAASEKEEAAKAYDHARAVYRQIISESAIQ
jgi:hypothetical protein